MKRLIAALACAGIAASPAAATQSAGAPRQHPAGPSRPNIVFVLTDDLSMNLLQFMPHVQAMEQQGLTFDNYFVSDSLCCPSRASIFTGNLPHDTRIFSNTGRQGGFDRFYRRHEEQQTFATVLHTAGYRTALMGKYLNGYMQDRALRAPVGTNYVPPGWSRWDGVGWGYNEFNYVLNQNHHLLTYGNQPSAYLTDALAGDAVDFIGQSAAAHRPFFLEVATFAPHEPYVPAPRNASDFSGLQAPRTPGFDRLPVNPPSWLAGHQPLTTDEISQIDSAFRQRAQSVEAVDAMIGQIEQTLQANQLAGNTYIVFSSDNGLHMGEYELTPGKMTAFDTDIHVPLIVTGPGVPVGVHTTAIAENIDLAKTFAQLGGTSLPGDGHSLMPLLQGSTPATWRGAALIEHRGPPMHLSDPDYQPPTSGNPTSYEAMRTPDFLYVEYFDGELEYYDLHTDPFELNNLAPLLGQPQLAQLHSELQALENCHGGPACWAAGHVPAVPAVPARIR
jgi:N-acetylglucosamine-6-sulfatase